MRFQNSIASDLPSFLVNPTQGLEDTAAARSALSEVRGESAHGVGGEGGERAAAHRERYGGHLRLPVLGKAPEFVDNQQWFNTPGDRPLTLRGLRGRVVLVDFWTYSCINCLRTLPYLKAWDQRYRKDGLTIVGVHSPEFPFEHDAEQRRRSDRAQRHRTTRSSRTTTSPPGTPTATSTGRPSTSSTPRATSATPTSARATTARKSR